MAMWHTRAGRKIQLGHLFISAPILVAMVLRIYVWSIDAPIGESAGVVAGGLFAAVIALAWWRRSIRGYIRDLSPAALYASVALGPAIARSCAREARGLTGVWSECGLTIDRLGFRSITRGVRRNARSIDVPWNEVCVVAIGRTVVPAGRALFEVGLRNGVELAYACTSVTELRAAIAQLKRDNIIAEE